MPRWVLLYSEFTLLSNFVPGDFHVGFVLLYSEFTLLSNLYTGFKVAAGVLLYSEFTLLSNEDIDPDVDDVLNGNE